MTLRIHDAFKADQVAHVELDMAPGMTGHLGGYHLVQLKGAASEYAFMVHDAAHSGGGCIYARGMWRFAIVSARFFSPSKKHFCYLGDLCQTKGIKYLYLTNPGFMSRIKANVLRRFGVKVCEGERWEQSLKPFWEKDNNPDRPPFREAFAAVLF